ncbi:MAG: c-type cytochrome [Candidatus Sulfotelmatobacter sp.]
MKKAKKIFGIGLGVLIVLIVAAISFTIGWRPFIGPRKRATTSRQFERTPQRLARGRYLATSLLGCTGCHSKKNWAVHGAPVFPETDFAGQVVDIQGFPGSASIPNITPDAETGGGTWTDDEFARAIREGIGHDGRTLFPMMPYEEFKSISDEDVASVVVYLRSIPPVKNSVPPIQVNFPVRYLVRSVPEPLTQPVHGPNPLDRMATGKYLANLGCGCHREIDAIDFGGGEHLKGAWGEVTSANITSDPSGIGYYTEASFIKTIRTGYVGARELNSVMPFSEFQNLTDDDLKAIFAYLRTVPPARHRVDNMLPPTYCKVCKHKHGGGDQN